MSDASLLWGGDLNSNSVGDISMLSEGQLGRQRVLRRLLTNPGDYVWQPTYGAGLGQLVGKPCDVQEVKATVRSQIFSESIVARIPEPTIDIEVIRDGSVYVEISYVESTTGTSQLLSFSLSA